MNYIAARDRYLEIFKSPDNYAAAHKVDRHNIDQKEVEVEEKKALSELESLLIPIVGCVNVDGFPREGKINITLIPDIVFGKVDGLIFSENSKYLFVTTEGLVRNYFAGHQKFLMGNTELPENIEDLSKSESFYLAAFTANAAVMRYVEIPVKTHKSGAMAYAFLGITTQMDGLPDPKEIFVFVKNEKQILMIFDRSSTLDTTIHKCVKQQERKSEPTIEKGGAYLTCYEREARNQPFFSQIQARAQKAVDSLLKY